MSLPQACLFDLDGLLIDTEPLHGQVWRNTALRFGGKINENQLKLLRGKKRVDCANQIIKWTNISVDLEEFLSEHKTFAETMLNKSKPMAGAEEFISWCYSKKIPMALVSSSTSESFKFKSQPHKWLQLIETRVLGDDMELKRGKPAPDPFLLGAKKLNIAPKDCWAFEDSKAGITSALAAGCQVWILREKEELIKKEILGKNPREINELSTALKELQKTWIG